MGVLRGAFALRETGTKNQIFLEYLTLTALYPLIAFILTMSLFAGMTLTLHRSQVHSSGVVQR